MNTNSSRAVIRISRDIMWQDSFKFYLWNETIHNGTSVISVANPTTFTNATEAEIGIQPLPMFHLRPDEAQNLMDELWRAGLRPTEGSGSAGSLAATERHLADMRSLVFKTKPA